MSVTVLHYNNSIQTNISIKFINIKQSSKVSQAVTNINRTFNDKHKNNESNELLLLIFVNI